MKDVEISLKDLFAIFMRRMKWIAAITVLSVILAVVITSFFITPMYTASTSLLVSSFGNKDSSDVTYAELSASQTLVDTYLVVLKSKSVLSEVSKELGDIYTIGQLSSYITATGVEGTQVIKVQVETSNAKASMAIANAVATVAPDVIKEKSKVGEVAVIDMADLPTSASSPNLMTNVVIAFLLGIVLSYGGFLVYELLDNIVRKEEDLLNTFDIPLLGTVPSMDDISSVAKGGAVK